PTVTRKWGGSISGSRRSLGLLPSAGRKIHHPIQKQGCRGSRGAPLMPRPFLTACWSNLFLATYAVPPPLLERRLPPGLQLDLRDGKAFVSLVAFDFFDTKVLGVPWPGYRDFAELNLRFYVHQDGHRGVMFIREFVPQRLVALLARLLYNEPYQA